MFYSATGNLITKNIIEGYSSEFDNEVNAFKSKIGYGEIKEKDSYKASQIDYMINQVVNDAEYQLNQMKGKNEEEVKKMKKDLKEDKQNNNLLRMLQYYSDQSFIMDDLYHNQDSLYNSILEIDGWSSSGSDEANVCQEVQDEIKETVKKYYSLRQDIQNVIIDYKRLAKQKRDNC